MSTAQAVKHSRFRRRWREPLTINRGVRQRPVTSLEAVRILGGAVRCLEISLEAADPATIRRFASKVVQAYRAIGDAE